MCQYSRAVAKKMSAKRKIQFHSRKKFSVNCFGMNKFFKTFIMDKLTYQKRSENKKMSINYMFVKRNKR